MAPKRNTLVLLACLMISTGTFADESVIDRTGSAVRHGANWTATKIEHGARAAGHGIRVGLDATGSGLHRAAEATSRAFHKVAGKLSGSSSG